MTGTIACHLRGDGTLRFAPAALAIEEPDCMAREIATGIKVDLGFGQGDWDPQTEME